MVTPCQRLKSQGHVKNDCCTKLNDCCLPKVIADGERESVCVCVCMWVCVHVCMLVHVCVCVLIYLTCLNYSLGSITSLYAYFHVPKQRINSLMCVTEREWEKRRSQRESEN